MEWHCSNKKEERPSRQIVLIKYNLWRKYLSEYKKYLISRIYTYIDITEVIKTAFIPLKMIFEILANSLLVLLKRGIKPALETSSNIAVLHAHGADLEKRADYFWFPKSSIDPKKILVYFKYHCWPAKEESVKLIESYGMRWVNLLPWKSSKLKFFSSAPEFYRLPHPMYIKKSIRTFFETVKLFFNCLFKSNAVGIWLWSRLVNLFNRSTLYEAFFTIYDIKVHYGLYNAGVDMMAENIAIDIVGGVDLCHHWSNHDITEISIGKPHDVQFSWGPYYRKYVFEKEFYDLKYLVYIGYPYDNNFVKCKQKAQQHRNKLLEKGVKFIVTFFDQDYPLSWPKTNENVKEIYRTFLDKVIKNPSLGLITKPKKVRNFWEKPGLSSLGPLAKKAENTGRCLFLDGNTFTNEAAQAADLVIGFGVYSTPALEAALAGVPSITCDLQNFSKHPFYQGGFNATVFNDLDTMMQSIEKFANRNGAYGRFGDYSFISENIDPFRDGRASERAGYFIKCLLGEFDKGSNRPEALETAVENYHSQWGDDKAVNLAKEKVSA